MITGGAVEAFERAADAMVAVLPNARRLVLKGQSHVVDATVMAAALRRFFA